MAYDISRKLAENGHSVVVYTSDILDENTRTDSQYRKVDGVDVFYFRNLSLCAARKKLYFTPSLILAVKNNIKSFDIVHIHGNRTTQSPILHYFLKKNSVPYVVQAHGGLPSASGDRWKQMYDLFFGYALLKDASKVIALTQTEVQQYLSMGVLKEKIEIVPNGIDLSEYIVLPPKGSFKRKFNIPEDKKIVLYLGRIHKTKGIDFLLRAYAYLTNGIGFNDSMLVIAGPDDGYLAEAKSLAISLGVFDSALFTGFISNKDKLEALVDANVFVTPSFYGFPMTFLEACATGTPIITTNLGDRLEWIDGNVGYVTPPTHHHLARAIHAIISNDELYERFSRNCRKTVQSKFSSERTVGNLGQMYEKVAK